MHRRIWVVIGFAAAAAVLTIMAQYTPLLAANGDKVIGLRVYDTPRSLAFQKQQQVVSTLLFLKNPDGNFIVYSLSGGP